MIGFITDTLIVGLIAAIVLAATTLWSIRRTARIQLATFRLDWIENLRNDLSKFQSLAMQPDAEPHKDKEFYELGTRIELRLNPDDEQSHRDLVDVMYQMLEVSSGSILEKYQTNPRFIELSQSIIKEEWDVVKREILGKRNA